MADSIALGPDGQANHTLDILRAEVREAPLTTDVELLPGLSLHADPALEIEGTCRSPEGCILELDARSGTGRGEWFGLHLGLPATDLGNRGVLGFAARIAAPEVQLVRACVRSGVEGGFVDCFFDKHLLFYPEEASHLDALPVHQRDALPLEARWRELILFLPPESFRLSLLDLRLFIV